MERRQIFQIDDDLADMLGLLHGAESGDRLIRRERPARQRNQIPRMQQAHDLLEKLCCDPGLRCEQLVNIDSEITDIFLERPQTDSGVLYKIPFPQL